MIRDFIFLVLFFIFLAIWGVSWFALHVTGGLIHLLLVVAAISLVLHFRVANSIALARRNCAGWHLFPMGF
jgi:small neutral amino acid transporter SnatA (MarC family)